MRCPNSQVIRDQSLCVSRRFVSSRLAENLLGKAYGCLVPPLRRDVAQQKTGNATHDRDSSPPAAGGDHDGQV